MTMAQFDITRPTLNWEGPSFGEGMQKQEHRWTLGFGYYCGEPTAALFHGDDLITLIPRDVLVAAVKEGWEDDD